MSNHTLCATAYDQSATIPYIWFTTLESFEEQAANNTNEYTGSPVEEYEIQYIDGPCPRLFEAAGIDQATLVTWFDELADIASDDGVECAALLYLMECCGHSISEALELYRDVQLFNGTAEEYAEELIDECYNLDEFAERYFDYEKFARDLRYNGDIYEIERDLIVTNANEF